jgi:hypothetical protein
MRFLLLVSLIPVAIIAAQDLFGDARSASDNLFDDSLFANEPLHVDGTVPWDNSLGLDGSLFSDESSWLGDGDGSLVLTDSGLIEDDNMFHNAEVPDEWISANVDTSCGTSNSDLQSWSKLRPRDGGNICPFVPPNSPDSPSVTPPTDNLGDVWEKIQRFFSPKDEDERPARTPAGESKWDDGNKCDPEFPYHLCCDDKQQGYATLYKGEPLWNRYTSCWLGTLLDCPCCLREIFSTST